MSERTHLYFVSFKIIFFDDIFPFFACYHNFCREKKVSCLLEIVYKKKDLGRHELK
jgi:hypothetical protein